MQAFSPHFGLLSLHTTGKNTHAYLYHKLGKGEISLNNKVIVQDSPMLAKLEASMGHASSGSDLVQMVQQPLISLVQTLPLSGQDKSRLVAMLSAPNKTHGYIQRQPKGPNTQASFSDLNSKK